jgi:hypothetical protein
MPNFRKRALAGRFERRKELCVRLGLSSPAALATFLQCGEEMIPTGKYPQPKVTIQLIKSTPLTIKMLKIIKSELATLYPGTRGGVIVAVVALLHLNCARRPPISICVEWRQERRGCITERDRT